MRAPTWITIDTAQLRDNLRALSTQAQKPVLAAVKANGYGHGAEIVARAFLAGGAAGLAVARLEEADALRRAGIDAKILIMGALLPEDVKAAAQAKYEFFVWTEEHISVLREVVAAGPIRVHLKIDTGMGRLGCCAKDAINIAKALRKISHVELEGLATHFASADSADPTSTQAQISAFNKAIAALSAENMRPRIVHAANSAGLLRFPLARHDMVRVGIAAYGIEPGPGLTLPDGVKPALRWHARIVACKIMPANHGVSYGSAYRTNKARKIAVVPIGYGDGFRRILNVNTVLLNGQERKVLGQVCMDQCMIDAEGLEDDLVGRDVIVLGEQLTASELARRWSTIPYEVLTSLAARVPRMGI